MKEKSKRPVLQIKLPAWGVEGGGVEVKRLAHTISALFGWGGGGWEEIPLGGGVCFILN